MERLELALQHRDRRAQLVGDVGHEVAARALLLLERIAEAVEVVDEMSQLVAAVRIHARRIVAVRELARRIRQALHRREQPASKQPRDDRGEDRREQQHAPSRPLLLLAEALVHDVERHEALRRGEPSHGISRDFDRMAAQRRSGPRGADDGRAREVEHHGRRHAHLAPPLG